MNLLEQAWIPAGEEAGGIRRISPAALADPALRRLRSPRADISCALAEFLIGLLQTAFAPEDLDAWLDLLDEPPSPDDLDAAFARFRDAFRLDGPGPRFLQDPSAADGKRVGIGQLLIDAPGDNAIRRNLDHFQKRGGVTGLCPGCAAAALWTLQAFAPAGGQGHRVSLRGGGPLTTLVVDGSLWRMLWFNVLTRRDLESAFNEHALAEKKGEPIFPWLREPLRVSDASGGPTRPGQVPLLQMYWGMPRRIWLDFEERAAGACGVCGVEGDELLTHYFTRPRGVNYEGGWCHPLTPHTVDPRRPDERLSRHGSPEGIDYRHWLGLIQEDRPSDRGLRGPTRLPALVVEVFRRNRLREIGARTVRLWAFGYDMDNMKARSWCESEMPIHRVEGDVEHYKKEVARLVLAADAVGVSLRRQVLHGWFRYPAEAKGDFSGIRAALMGETEAAFFAALTELAEIAERHAQDSQARMDAEKRLRIRWHKTLDDAAIGVFDRLVIQNPVEDHNFERVAKALQHLKWDLRSSRVLDALQLRPDDLDNKAEAAAPPPPEATIGA